MCVSDASQAWLSRYRSVIGTHGPNYRIGDAKHKGMVTKTSYSLLNKRSRVGPEWVTQSYYVGVLKLPRDIDLNSMAIKFACCGDTFCQIILCAKNPRVREVVLKMEDVAANVGSA